MSTSESDPVRTNNGTKDTQTGTHQIANRLQDAEFDIHFQRGSPAPARSTDQEIAFIEVLVKENEIKTIEKILDEVATPIPHRLITPTDTPSLPIWTSSSSPANPEKRIIIVPSNYPQPKRAKSEHTATHL